MSICLVKQNDGMWVEKHQRFLFNVYKHFFIFVTFLRFFNVFFKFLERFFYIYGWFEHCVSSDTEQDCSVRRTKMTGRDMLGSLSTHVSGVLNGVCGRPVGLLG